VENRFGGRTVLVTGAARGQGRSHAVSFAREGANVAICDICEDLSTVRYGLGTEADLTETAVICAEAGAEVLRRKVDVRTYPEFEAFAKEAESEFGKIDVLVANAGIFSHGTVTELTEEQWDQMLDVNLRGVWHAMKAVVPGMSDRGYGRIVVIGSSSSSIGYPNVGHYTAAKHGVLGLTKSLAMEQAKNGVTANCVCPTGVGTQMILNEPNFHLMSPDNPTLEGVTAVTSAMNPQGDPWLEPEEVSRLVLFLASEGAAHITGAEMRIDMGLTAI
jgi:SDR family mycofactocin-dependent oxidoreductase